MTRSESIGLGVALVGHILLFAVLSLSIAAREDLLPRESLEVSLLSDVALESMSPNPDSDSPAPSIAPEVGPIEDSAEQIEEAAPSAMDAAPERTIAPRAEERPAKPTPKPVEKPREQRPTGGRLGDDFTKGISDNDRGTSQTAPAKKMGPSEARALFAEISRQLRPHWDPPSGADADQLRTQLSVRLNRDGSLAGEPEVVGQTGVTASNRNQADLHAERAIRAVRRAAPFKNLPPEYYEEWKWLKPLNFDARLAR